MEITVKRHPGGVPAPDIVEPLLASLPPALARGRKELDDGEGLQSVRLTLVYRPDLNLGDLVEVMDRYQGRSYRGKVTAVEHKFDGVAVTTDLEISRRGDD